jgi:hypothetical protein
MDNSYGFNATDTDIKEGEGEREGEGNNSFLRSTDILRSELVNHADPAVLTCSGAPCRPCYMDSIWSHSHLATPTSAACSSLDDD